MTTSTRSRISAILLITGILAFSVGDLVRRLIEPDGAPDGVAITGAVDQHPVAWLAAGLLALIAGICLTPSAIAFISGPGRRGSRTTTWGAAMIAIGAMASLGHAVAFYSPYALFAAAGTDDSQIRAIDHASEASALLIVLIVTFILGMMLGSIILLVGLRRARRVPIWSVIAAVVFVACGSTAGVAAGAVGILAALGAFIPAARALVVNAQADRPDQADPELEPRPA